MYIPKERVDKTVDLDIPPNETMEQSILDTMFWLPNGKDKNLENYLQKKFIIFYY